MNFLKYRYVFLTISLIIIISGLTFGFVNGFEFDIDFKGGTRIQIDLKTEFDNNELETMIGEIIGSKPLVQKLSSGESSVSITTDVISEETSNLIINALNEKYPDMAEPTIRNVQPSYGDNLIQSSILAIILSVVFILIYVGIRFRSLGFSAAITAIFALVHDVLVIIAIYGFLRFPINSTFVAVLLTIIGYSINDTIIVYDRIRENKRKVTNTNLLETINYSISQTMRRTINTTFTTVSATLIVLIFAQINNQQVLKEFSLPLSIGMIVGAYSSIFIAASLWYIIDNYKMKKVKVKK